MGGLAYDLNTVAIPEYQNWQEILYAAGALRTNTEGLVELWAGIEALDFGGGAPGEDVSDIIIRGSRFANDYYYIWGSYRALFQELHGAGVDGVAWDGFVTIIPAHAMLTRWKVSPIDGVTPESPHFQVINSSYSWPMRLPYKLSPGAVGDAAAIAADSEVGVHALDYALGLTELKSQLSPIPPGVPRIGVDPSNSPSLDFSWMGHQRTVAANGTLDMPYIGCGGTYEVDVVLPEYGGIDETAALESIAYRIVEDWGWSRTDADTRAGFGGGLTGVNNFPVTGDPHGVSQLQTRTSFYARDETNDIADTLLSNFNKPTGTSGYYLSRIYDMVSFADPRGVSLVVGEASRINAAGTAVAGTVPFTAIWKSGWSDFVELNYPASTPSQGMVFKAAVPPNFITDPSIAAYDYEGAWANVISPPLMRNYQFDLNEGGFPISFLVGINNLEIGGVKTCAVLGAASEDVIYGGGYENVDGVGAYDSSFMMVPVAIKGNPFTTLTGIALPEGTGSKWMGRAQQQATFTPPYERACKRTDVYQSWLRGEFPEGITGFIVDPDLEINLLKDATITTEEIGESSLVGCNPDAEVLLGESVIGTGNISLSGLSNKARPTVAQPYSNLGYGFLAYVPNEDPYVFMYDYGTVSVLIQTDSVLNPPVAPAEPIFDIRASGLQEGDKMNAAFTINPTSTTRHPISASWDNDRDQWIFTFADTVNGFGFMSVNSAFDQQEGINQFSFLDQTDNFAIPGAIAVVDPNPESCIYTARMMTPILDGVCIVGATDDVSVKGQRALTAIGLPAPSATGTEPNFIVYTITGSTGRSANVWVDYLLFDGIDSLIATELQTMGLRVNVENVEWYKAKIIRKGDLGFTPEEIEDWVRSQQEEYKATQRLKQRQGRSRVKKRQVQAWQEDQADFQELVDGDFTESGGFDSLKSFDEAAAEYIPDPSQATPDSSRKEKNKSGKR